MSAVRPTPAPAPRVEPASPVVEDMYASIDAEINSRVGVDIGFEVLLRAAPCEMDAETVAGFSARHSTIEAFQQRCLAVFNASLRGDADPRIAAMVLGDVAAEFGVEYHRGLSDLQHRTPVFYRTDELTPGKLSEIQCPGSAWEMVGLLRRLYSEHPEVFGAPLHFHDSVSAQFARAVRRHVGGDPVIHHLTDNASLPHGNRLFIQQTRDEGLRYFGYDRGVHSGDCNFVRAHDYVSVLHHNFYAERMRRCDLGELCFDLPPSALFDSKLPVAWPFWSVTREHFVDADRDLFPFTAPITPDGIEMPDGPPVSLARLFERGHGRTGLPLYVKYAGTDIAINWGSKAVYLINQLSRSQARGLMDRISEGWDHGRLWIVQSAIRPKETISVLHREGDVSTMDAYAKWSGFYGPDGLMAINAFHRRFHKVHGNPESAASIVY